MRLLCRTLGGLWPSFGLATGPPATGTICGPDRSPDAKVVVVLFDRCGRRVAIAKVARSAVAERALRAEHAALLRLAGVPLPVPRPLSLLEVGGRLVLVQTPVPGRAMTTAYYAPGHTSDVAAVGADFAEASAWLDAFHAATAQGRTCLAEEAVSAHVAAVLGRYRCAFGAGTAEEDLFAAVLDRCRALGRSSLPLAGSHGDYWMGNLLLDGGRITGVVDWEDAERRALPFRDVFKFPTSYAFYLDRSCPWGDGAVAGHPGREDRERRWRRFGDWPNLLGFGHAYFGRGWFPEQVRRHVEGALGTRGIDPALTGVFFPLFLAEQATVLTDPAFRSGYRSLVRAFAEERSSTWLWHAA